MNRRIVIKVGSNTLTRRGGTLDTTIVSSLVDQIVELREMGYEVILVSSGAVACGRKEVTPHEALNEVQQRQLYSAVGQIKLMSLYSRLFGDYGIGIGQVLTQKKNFEAGEEYDNQKGCIEVMLACGVIPIVNENDTVSITELMFTDNDELSGLVALMMEAGTLIILSNVDGIYNAAPGTPGAEVIRKIQPGEDISKYILTSKSSSGRGGMGSKSGISSQMAAKGVRVMIANGKTKDILLSLHRDPENTVHTEFIPAKKDGRDF